MPGYNTWVSSPSWYGMNWKSIDPSNDPNNKMGLPTNRMGLNSDSKRTVQKFWRQLDDFHSLTDLKIAVSSHKEPQITAGLRSVCWKIFLLFKSLDRSTWPTQLTETRSTYNSLRSHYLRAIQHPDEFESSVDPLSENEESPWVALRADENLRAEIFQDIERCMPDNVYFRQPATQNMMLDVLFVFCKMNENIGYRQGMHEILAPILWVVERDAVDRTGPENRSSNRAYAEILDSKYIEHDTYTLFTLVMRTAKEFYAPAESGAASKDTPMLIRSSRIFDRYLPKADPALSEHLIKLEIVPQIFLLRWIRLLFGREFPLDSVLKMWDALFAIDSTLELVDMISVAMLLRIRWKLIASDTNEVFTLLLRYPEPDAPAYTFIKDALYLRDHLTPEGGAEIITRYGQKAPPIEKKAPEERIPSPPPSFASSRTRPAIGSPRSFMAQQSGGIESLLQNAAKGVLDRGSQWGVGKAIRDAVGEVKKNVEAIQSGPASGQTTPRSGGREFRRPAPIGTAQDTRAQLGVATKRIEALEKRNKNLAEMLEGAVGSLWEYHKNQSDTPKEDKKDMKEQMESLSLAIAKVQFVQVYLEDSSIPLPTEDPASGTVSPKPTTTAPIPERTSSAPPASSPTRSRQSKAKATAAPAPATPRVSSPVQQEQPMSPPAQPPTAASAASLSPRSRPLLTSSNFSWMLGGGGDVEPARSTFAKASEHTAFPSDEKRRMRGNMGKGYLFGDEEEDDTAAPKGQGKRGSVSGKGAKKGKEPAEMEVEEEIIDLEDVGKSRAVS
ncbi:RabGAP/TBC [Aaosphaeria arxii CBS 175.79]|uniref:RabGAP/TBC n=1 Tax=Aaosphaeria arxii CBS 175.79 TaxID=1450172 RepID=A0A6A5Y752_9PLEO|nr:RabGAP/TBC [Aaosphaeria arxii CBS 175.79]KAF2020630.1 RabGAP/TBC [Aaosphaeria arxii CBS 175.79]